MAGHGGGQAFLGKFALARARDPDHGQGAQAAESVNGRGSRGVQKTRSEAEVGAQLSQPSAAPGPMGDEGKEEGRQHRRRHAAGRKAPAIGSRPPGNDGCHGDGHEFKQGGKLRFERSGGEMLKKQGSRAEQVPGLAREPQRMRGRAGKGGADHREPDGRGRDDGHGSQQGLGGGARSSQARIDQGNAGDGQRGKQQQSQGQRKHGFGEGLNRRGKTHGRRAPRGPPALPAEGASWRRSMWPRTATPSPRVSTARPQTTNVARNEASGNRMRAATVRKNPAGITSNPAYFMAVPFKMSSADMDPSVRTQRRCDARLLPGPDPDWRGRDKVFVTESCWLRSLHAF